MVATATVVNVSITIQSSAISRTGFGTILLAAFHTNFLERVRSYDISTVLTDLVTDGFAVTDTAYLMAQAVSAQSPRPPTVKIGRLEETPNAQQIILTVDSASLLATYSVKINSTTFAHTEIGGQTPTALATALHDLINAGSEPVTSTDNLDGTLDLDADVAADRFSLELTNDTGVRLMSRDETTADPGYATDFAAIVAEDDDWYGLDVEGDGGAIVEAVATWAESAGKLFVHAQGDTDIIEVGTSDTASVLSAASRARTAIYYSPFPHQYGGAGAMGERFPDDPGSSTWAHKTISGFTATGITNTESTKARVADANTYELVGGVNIALFGTVASGEFIDVIRGTDWLEARITESVFGLKTSTKKIPFTNKGGAMIQAAIEAPLRLAVSRGVLAESPAPVTTVPDVSTVSAGDKAARDWPGITFTGRIAGAVHTSDIAGTVSL